jgi:hypothetical protein
MEQAVWGETGARRQESSFALRMDATTLLDGSAASS